MDGVDVTGVVGAPINKVWELYRVFGEGIMKWWPIYTHVELKEGTDSVVGCKRFLKTKTGRTYLERLDTLDDENHKLVYSLLEISPSVPTLKTIVTTVQMAAKNEQQTTVHWSSDIDAGSLVMGKVKAVQAGVYTAAIKSLDTYFNPSLGVLQVEVVSAKNLKSKGHFAPNPYLVVDLDSSAPATSKVVRHSEHPKWNDSLQVDVVSKEGRLDVSVWDDNVLAHDDFLGKASIDIHSLEAGKRTFKTLTLEGVNSGQVTLALTLKLKDGDALETTDATKEINDLEHMKSVLGDLRDQAMTTLEQLSGVEPERYGYARYPRSPLYPDVDLENLPKMVDALHMSQVLQPEKLGKLAQRTTEYLYSQVNFIQRSENAETPYHAIFGDWTENNWIKDIGHYVKEHWQDDVEFCRQLLQGVNPTTLRKCDDLRNVPEGLLALESQGKTAQALHDEDRLFILDYALLADMPKYLDMVVYAPVALVYRELLDYGSSRLNLLGFQLTRKNDGSDEIFTASSNMPNRYLLAKMHLSCADNQYHQFIQHLGFAHLAMEPFAIAHHNCFPKQHKLGAVMAPHFRDTIGINFLARQTLVSPIIPFTDRTFSLGTAGSLWLFLKAYKEWDFKTSSFPTRMNNRGFDEKRSDKVENYFYRDDGFMIWNALKSYFSDVIATIYASDNDVQGDAAIRDWCDELNDPERGNVKGFPTTINTRDELTETVTTVVFNVSAQHSAVNFSQLDYITFVPNRPDSMFAPMPEDRTEVTQDDINNALPSVSIAQFQAMFAWLLTQPSDHCLGDLEGSKEHFPELHEKHTQVMAEISAKIENRNATLINDGKMPYPYLDPKRIAASIDI